MLVKFTPEKILKHAGFSGTGVPPDVDRDKILQHRPGVDFINILLAAFTREEPMHAKRLSSCQCLFARMGT